MIPENQPRMVTIALRDVCFLSELPFLLGSSEDHVRKLVTPPQGRNHEWYRSMKFPEPFMVSDGGIRVWFVRDVRQWALGVRSKATGFRKRRGVPVLDSPELVSETLGL